MKETNKHGKQNVKMELKGMQKSAHHKLQSLPVFSCFIVYKQIKKSNACLVGIHQQPNEGHYTKDMLTKAVSFMKYGVKRV